MVLKLIKNDCGFRGSVIIGECFKMFLEFVVGNSVSRFFGYRYDNC